MSSYTNTSALNYHFNVGLIIWSPAANDTEDHDNVEKRDNFCEYKCEIDSMNCLWVILNSNKSAAAFITWYFLKTRPSKLCESQIFRLWVYLKNIHLWKIITPEKYSPLKNIHSWKYPLLKIFTQEKYSLQKNSQPWKIFTPGKYSP